MRIVKELLPSHLVIIILLCTILLAAACKSKQIQANSGAYVTIDGTNDGLQHIQKDFQGATKTNEGILVTFDSDVLFALNSADLSSRAKSELNKLVALLEDRPQARLVVDGHTDATGPAAFNQTLSEKRAQSVKAHLVSRGMQASRIRTNGYGQTRPVASNDTQEGRLKNRRVEITIVD